MDRDTLYREKAEAKLDEWSAELDKLKARARQEGADAALDLDKKFDEFQRNVSDGIDRLRASFSTI